MAARDRIEIEITCPQCAQKGQLDVSENDYPFMKKLNRTIDRIQGNFEAICVGFSYRITCKACGNKFEK